MKCPHDPFSLLFSRPHNEAYLCWWTLGDGSTDDERDDEVDEDAIVAASPDAPTREPCLCSELPLILCDDDDIEYDTVVAVESRFLSVGAEEDILNKDGCFWPGLLVNELIIIPGMVDGCVDAIIVELWLLLARTLLFLYK
jgi:hypothetical protein